MKLTGEDRVSKSVLQLVHKGMKLTVGNTYRVPMRATPARMFNTRGLAMIVELHSGSITWRWAGQSKKFYVSLDDFVRMIRTGRLPTTPDFR